MFTFLKRARRGLGLLVAAMLLAALAASPAMAGEDVYINGGMGVGGTFGPTHTIYSNAAESAGFAGDAVCANAMNQTGTSWVGATQCNSALIGIGYCQCALRIPWAGPQTQEIQMEAWSDW